MADVSLSADAERIFETVDALCRQLHVAIVAPEHVLAAAVMEMERAGAGDLPAAETLVRAATAVHGTSADPLSADVKWGSGTREALNVTVRTVSVEGSPVIDARRFALGIISSGELNPGFFAAAGTTKAALVAALSG